ncbi:MAG TPA: endonuclease/exonuclease/phosphatase family protein [Bacteroides sp.]|nr:endonuclease/exonuclease/phosphatase family protein [Bacteroides sp.]
MKLRTLLFSAILIISADISSSQVISIMTYNIRYDTRDNEPNTWTNRKDYLGKQLQFFEPDIFGIQEGLHHQVQYLDSIMPEYNYAGIGRDDGKEKGEYSAIFYNTEKFEILDNSTFWLSETIDKPSVGWDASMERICTYGLFQSKESGEKIWVFNTHFDHRGVEARKNSARLIVEQISAINTGNYPVVFMGDLNLTPDSEAILYLSGILNDTRDSAIKVSFGPKGTSNGFNFEKPVTKRIDYIFTSRTGIQVNKFAILSESFELRYPSDHFPVYVEIEF